MSSPRVLFTIPYPLGTSGIATTALQQVCGTATEGCPVTVFTSGLAPGVRLADSVSCVRTLSVGSYRIRHGAIGRKNALRYHDRRVSFALRRHPEDFDVVHCWPGACHEVLATARELGIPALRESPSAHTAEALHQSAIEQELVGVPLGRGHAFAANPEKIRREEEEYALAAGVLVPSSYVEQTFLHQGVAPSKLVRHQYGFDPERFRPPPGSDPRDAADHQFEALFVGRCEPTKGLHYALEAWHASGASRRGRFLIVGAWVPGYLESLASLVDHPSVELRPFSPDVSGLMQAADVVVLASVTEGSALVTYEAQGCGAALLVSDASGAVCEHRRQGLVHAARDVAALTEHFSELVNDRDLGAELRRNALAQRDNLTWATAGRQLAGIYRRYAPGS